MGGSSSPPQTTQFLFCSSLMGFLKDLGGVKGGVPQ